MNTEFIDKSYIITYSNWFEFNGKILAYRKKVLFDITETPKALFISNNNGSHGYWINRKWLSESKIKGSETLTYFKQAIYFKELGFNVHDTMIYQKNSYPFPPKNRYYQVFEYMFVFSKGKPKTTNILRVHTIGYKHKASTQRQKDGTMTDMKYKMGLDTRKDDNIWKLNVGYGKSSLDKISLIPTVSPTTGVKSVSNTKSPLSSSEMSCILHP